jgi:partner of Y14 and mago protein
VDVFIQICTTHLVRFYFCHFDTDKLPFYAAKASFTTPDHVIVLSSLLLRVQSQHGVGLAMSTASKAGIQTAADGVAYIPSSRRADGSTRKEIKVRPGYRPPEDVETYKNRGAEAWKNRGKGGVPGAESLAEPKEESAAKSTNAKRREAAKRRAALAESTDAGLALALQKTQIEGVEKEGGDFQMPAQSAGNEGRAVDDEDAERQKKIRNQLKRLKAVRELKSKKVFGEKLSPDQLMKIGKEGELLRDLKKLGYEGPELLSEETASAQQSQQST